MNNSRKFLLPISVTACLLFFASCTKDCYTCTVSTTDNEKICKADYKTTKEYTDALKVLKTLGYKCN